MLRRVLMVFAGVLGAGCLLLALGSGAAFAAAAPEMVAGSAAAVNLTASSVDLYVQIDPEELATTYSFEYGTSTGYGASVPAGEGSIAAGGSAVAETVHLSGLSAEANIYHWRVVARNADGTTTGVDHTFVYDTSGAGLPDGRAYEMVTPPSKNAALLVGQIKAVSPIVAEDGSRVLVESIECFGEASGSCLAHRTLYGEPYAFTRTSGGWVTSALAPPATQYDENTALLASADSDSALFLMPTSPFGEEDWYLRGSDGALADVGPYSQPSLGFHRAEFLGEPDATAGMSHIVYQDVGYRWSFDLTRFEAGTASSLLEYAGVGNTQPVLVGVTGGPGSSELISVCGTHLAGYYTKSEGRYTLSADGRTMFFAAQRCPEGGSGSNAGVAVPAEELYARIGGSRTVWVSQRSPAECTSSECLISAPRDAEFQGQSEDGSKAFFTSTQQLTDGASEDSNISDTANQTGCTQTPAGASGCNLYEYDFDNPAGHNLVLVSAADGSVDGPVVAGGPRVQGVMAISSDGSHVYFIAQGVLTSVANGDGQSAQNGAENLYVFERDATYPQGHIAFIAALPGEAVGFVAEGVDGSQWVDGVNNANVTPEGRFLVFTSHMALTSDDTRGEGPAQVYRYDAATGELVRISIGNNGFNDNGNMSVGDAGIVPAFGRHEARAGWPRLDPSMSDDGSSVFFTSPVALAPGALNDVPLASEKANRYAENVYEWHEGHIYLISDGRDTSVTAGVSSVKLLGSDTTGTNVFFTTADPLVPADTDTQDDIYDARVCTASEPCISSAPPVVSCIGEACHGTPSSAPSLLAPVSATFSGAGNLAPPQAKPVIKVKKKVKHARTAHGKKPVKAKRGKPRRAVSGRVHVKRRGR